MNYHQSKGYSFLLYYAIIFVLTEFDFMAQTNVPPDYSTTTAAINAASDGDTILVAPGTYQENIEIPNKLVVLASWFLTTGDTTYVNQTILDSSDGISTIVYSLEQAVRFANIGDFGDDGQEEEDVSGLVNSWNVDFIFTNGDNNYPDGAASTIDDNIGQYYREYIDNYQGNYPGNDPPVNGFFPCLGNHDWRTRSGNPALPYPYLDYFALPGASILTTGTSGNERYYDFIIGPVHFFAIDSDEHEPDGRTSTSIQGQWLQAQLAASTSKWKVVFMHHPPFSSSSKHGSQTEMQWPYEDWGADVVFAGHDHTYERILKDDNNDSILMPYFVNGLGGRSRYSFGTPIPGSEVRYADDFGAMLIDANEESMTFQFYARTGQLIDTYTMQGSPMLTVTSPNGGETWEVGSTQDITWSSEGSVSDVKLDYSTDGGTNWSPIIGSTPNTGSYSWTVPNDVSATARVRVSDAVDGDPVDMSDNDFSIVATTVLVEAKIFLEGPYNSTTGEMTTSLNTNGYIPEDSPYSEDPRTVSPIPADITDWVLVQLRETASGAAVGSRSALLRKDGLIVGNNGTTEQITVPVSPGDYYIVIKHRNHLAVMSANPVQLSNGSSTLYDFTTGSDNYFGGNYGCMQLEASVWGVIAGDGNNDGGVYGEDYTLYQLNQGEESYHAADFNMDGGVYGEDYTIYQLNQGLESTVPAGN